MPKGDVSKKDILEVEKRVVDLELAVNELKEGFSNVDLAAGNIKEKLEGIDLSEVPELKRKLEDVEDLVMVENAGILELKKMMEEAKGKFETPSISPELAEKLEKVEKDITALSGAPSSVEIVTLHDKLEKINGDLSSLTSRVEGTFKELSEKLKEIESKEPAARPGVDFDLLSAKIESFKSSVDDVLKKKTEVDLKIVGIEKELGMMEEKMRSSLSERISDEIKINKKDIVMTNARIDSLERVARDLVKTNQEMESSIKKFEGWEKISLLSKEVEEKIERFKFIENELSRMSSKMEMMYSDIDKRLERIRGIDKEVSRLSESLSSLAKEFDKTKLEALSRVKKEDLQVLSRKMEKTYDEMKRLRPYVETRFSEMNKGLPSLVENATQKLNKRIELVEDRLKDAERSKIEILDRMKRPKIDEIQKLLDNTNLRISQVEEGLKKEVKKMESLVTQRIEGSQAQPTFLDQQISELLNRIVFLETRLLTVENMMQETSRSLPIVIE